MKKAPAKKTLYDAYRFKGFTTRRELKVVQGEPRARILRLNRRSKKQSAALVVPSTRVGMTKELDEYVTFRVEILSSTWSLKCVGSSVGVARP